jgi:hypothetical protein
MNESDNIFVSSIGILKSCEYFSTTPRSSIKYMTNYPQFSKLATFNVPIIYVCGSAIPHFILSLMPLQKTHFILVSGDCDETIPNDVLTNEQLNTFLDNTLLKCWFSQNMVMKHPKITCIPIGLDYHTMTTNPIWGPTINTATQEHILKDIKEKCKHFSERTIKCYSNFHFSMNTKHAYDRKDALTNIPKDLMYYEENHIPRTVSWNKQKDYAFVISPHGGGLDCHRTWEALVLGCIPIVKKSNIDVLYERLPVLIVDKWEDVTFELLQQTIDAFKSQEFQLERLTLKYWMDLIRSYK